MTALAIASAVLALSRPAAAMPVAQQVTALNAGTSLFGGSDADGGIDDWHLSNGVVEAIIDDVGPQADLVPLVGPAAPPKLSEFAFTGCSLLDLGTSGDDNDQLVQHFIVGGLSTSNFIVYDSISSSSTPTTATISCTGRLLGFSPVLPSDLPVTTEYSVSGSDPFVTVTTTVTNTSASTAPGLGGFLDVMLWTQRAQVPFTPAASRGFRHAILNLSNPVAALEFPPFSAAPGVLSPADGMIDPVTGNPSGETSYGMLGEELSVDQDGPGGSPPVVSTINVLFGVSSNLLTALGNGPIGSLNSGGILIYKRRFYVGDRNDVASVANLMIPELASRQGFSTGTISGNVDAADSPDVAASVVATVTAGSAPGFGANVPATHFRTDATGAFSGVVLPVGTYSLQIQSPERDPVTVTGVVVSASSNTAVSIPAMSSQGTLSLTVLENVSGPDPAMPGKVTLIGVDGTPNPRFRKDFDALGIPSAGPDVDFRAETFGGGAAQANFVYLADGTETVKLRPGKYELYASRGPEYTIRRKKVTIKAGKTKNAKFKLKQVVDTTGFLSADFHVHSGRSLDTQAGVRDRVVSFVGEQVEVMVSTDHDFHLDYGPVISSLGLSSEINSIVGNEVTGSVPNAPAFPDSIGHINAWPLTVQADERRDGAIEDEFVAPNFLFKRLRDQGADVIQYNHVRAGVSGVTSIGFFNNIGCNRCENSFGTACMVDADCPPGPGQNCTCIGYQPSFTIGTPPNDLLLDDDVLGPGVSGVANPDGIRNIDFDAMEIMNGTDIGGYVAVRRDWLSLLNQTDLTTVPFIKGTGVSDSHRITLESAGYARSYVGGAGDDPAALNAATLNANILAGNLFGTTGPFVRFSVSETGGPGTAGLGQTLVPATSNVTLHIEVQAAPWIPVDEVRVISNGFTTLTFDENSTPAVEPAPNRPWAQSPRSVVRFEADIPLSVGQDTYFIVEAGTAVSPLPTPDPFLTQIVPDLIPIAFTNPIFVDLLGDGFDPPGLPVMALNTRPGDAPPVFARVERLDRSWLARTGDRLRAAFASAFSTSSAIAEPAGEEALTGSALAEQVQRDKDVATEDYFPLYRFKIPEDAVDQAIEQQPEPRRSQLRSERARARGVAAPEGESAKP